MFPVMKRASKMNGYLFCVMLAIMLIYSLPNLFRFAKEEQNAMALFLDGKLSRKFEQQYDSTLFLREKSVEYWANFQYVLFNEGLNGVMIGSHDWLFTKEEFVFSTHIEALIDQYFEQISEIRQKMAKAGKRLIVIPVPMKLEIYGEYAPFEVQQNAQKVYAYFTRLLESNNIAFVPIRESFLSDKNQQELLFFKKDTHWTPRGANLAARELAARFPDLIGSDSYESYSVSAQDLKGDLLNYIKISPWLDPDIRATEPLARFQTTKTTTENDANALFGEAKISIALVGTSYSAMDEWNFTGFLKEHLKSDVLSVAVKEKGPFAAMEDFFDKGLLEDDAIQTVIWEFPVRALISTNKKSNAWQVTMDQIF